MQRIKILVVDDDPVMLEAVSAFLESETRSVIPASGGKEALAFLEKKRFDCVITDLRMPEVDGRDILKYVAKMPEPRPPVIIMTGCSKIEEESEAMKLGAAAEVYKPFKGKELVDLVTKFTLRK